MKHFENSGKLKLSGLIHYIINLSETENLVKVMRCNEIFRYILY